MDPSGKFRVFESWAGQAINRIGTNLGNIFNASIQAETCGDPRDSAQMDAFYQGRNEGEKILMVTGGAMATKAIAKKIGEKTTKTALKEVDDIVENMTKDEIKDVSEKMAVKEALSDAKINGGQGGKKIINKDKIKDPKYNGDFDKHAYNHDSLSGKKTEIHYMQNKSGNIKDPKIKRD